MLYGDRRANNMKKILVLLLAIFVTTCSVQPIYAYEKEAGATASLSASFGELKIDMRYVILKGYLESIGSPMADKSQHFINEADRFGLDWRLVPAIAGVESYFGQHIPANSYNAWGWAIFTGKTDGRHFEGWEDGITTVAQGLKEKYINRGLDTVWSIGPIYAADVNWPWKVEHFMKEIESYAPNSTSDLAISL